MEASRQGQPIDRRCVGRDRQRFRGEREATARQWNMSSLQPINRLELTQRCLCLTQGVSEVAINTVKVPLKSRAVYRCYPGVRCDEAYRC